MKRKMYIFIVCVCLAAGVFSGCGKKGNVQNSSVVSEATVENKIISSDALLEATEYKISDYVTLNDYQNMDIHLDKDYNVTDLAIKEAVNDLLKNYPGYEKTDKKVVEQGDIVNIDYTGKLDGEEFEGGSDTGYHLKIGSGSFINGFEDGLIGKEAGDNVTLNLKFPEDYNSPDVAGKDVSFEVKINFIEKSIYFTSDTMTDEIISDILGDYGITTTDQVESIVKQNLESTNFSQKTSDIQNLVLEKLVKECKVTIPTGVLESKIDQNKKIIKYQMGNSDKTFEEYIGKTEKEFEDDVKALVTKELILEAIVEDMDISISESDFSDFVNECMSQYGYSDETLFFDNYGGREAVKLSYAANVALNKLVSLYV